MLKLEICLVGLVLTVAAFAHDAQAHGYICAGLTGLAGLFVPTGGEDE
jgi:hypothetical protein